MPSVRRSQFDGGLFAHDDCQNEQRTQHCNHGAGNGNGNGGLFAHAVA